MDVEQPAEETAGITIPARIPIIPFLSLFRFKSEIVWMTWVAPKSPQEIVSIFVDYRKRDRQRSTALMDPNIFRGFSRK
jgi:hypothetical protein